MSAAEFLDSNVLIYTDDHDAPRKQATALSLVDNGLARRDTFVSTQVLAEYFSAATKKLRVPADIAGAKVALFARLQVVGLSADDVLAAIDLHRLHRLSIWDALVIRSARKAGCSVLWTEDLQDGRSFDGLVIRNPFAG
jgi:predicted nucleic acid-binding protein